MKYFTTAIIGYLIGSFSTAYFIGRAKGIDIREKGSNNAGASNIKVNFGWGLGIVTALVDMFKAFAAITICRNLFPNDEIIPFLAGAMAVIGHMFPFYLNFRAGKGFATYIGMVLTVNWKLGLAIMLMTAIVTVVSNYIFIATVATVTVVPVYYICTKADIPIIAILIVLGLIIIYKHKINFIRLINHEEIGLREKKR